MKSYSAKTENKNNVSAAGGASRQTLVENMAQKTGDPRESMLQPKFQTLSDSSPQVREQARLVALANSSPVAQAKKVEEEEKSTLQAKFDPIQRKPNNTGLPDQLKSGVEALSGYSMDDVKVHYNSGKPAQLNAHAYAQGVDIHIAPGQEKHLPHEAWHVVQQKQGRVKPTMQMKGNVPVNDDEGLEKEADVMGERALQLKSEGAEKLHSTPVIHQVSQLQEKVMQMWTAVNYNVDNSARTLHVEEQQTEWGGTGGPGNHVNHPGNSRAILFETMCRENGFMPLANRLSQPASLWDTGLSVVVNRAYTPAKIYDGDGNQTQHNKTQGDTLNQVQGALAQTFGQINGWAGMPVNVVLAAWERREVDRGNGSSLEAPQGSVPYSTFRRIAAMAQGAAVIENELQSNHDEGKVWRKMGDDDMPYVNPNVVNPETQELANVEGEGQIYMKPTMVTFGYNLTTAGTQPPITNVLQRIYEKEMALRDAIAALGAPMYPSEPTTFYQPRVGGDLSGPWAIMEDEKVGGSGQQLEGAKLAKAMNKDGGYNHYTFHTIMVNTGAGARNDALVQLLNGWYNNGQGDPVLFRPDAVEDEINKLDQSALREDEYLKKVVSNLGGQLQQETHRQIVRLVRQYRREAAEEACQILAAAIPQQVQQQHKDQRFLNAWANSQQERWNKWG